MRWELQSYQHLLSVALSQQKQLALQVSSIIQYILNCSPLSLSLCIGSSDFARLTPINVISNIDDPVTEFRLFTTNDKIALENDDRILLRFTPTQDDLIPGLARYFQYIRDTAIINIIDIDCKCIFHKTNFNS